MINVSTYNIICFIYICLKAMLGICVIMYLFIIGFCVVDCYCVWVSAYMNACVIMCVRVGMCQIFQSLYQLQQQT